MFFRSTLLTQLYVRVDIFMHMLNTLDHIVSLREEVWTHETILTPPIFFIEVSVIRHEIKRSYISISVTDIKFTFFNTIFSIRFLSVPTLVFICISLKNL